MSRFFTFDSDSENEIEIAIGSPEQNLAGAPSRTTLWLPDGPSVVCSASAFPKASATPEEIVTMMHSLVGVVEMSAGIAEKLETEPTVIVGRAKMDKEKRKLHKMGFYLGLSGLGISLACIGLAVKSFFEDYDALHDDYLHIAILLAGVVSAGFAVYYQTHLWYAM